jgi:hypothetical protein
MDLFDSVKYALGDLNHKEFKRAESARRRKTAVYYDAIASMGQSPGNSPTRLELAWVVLFNRGEL